MRKRRAVNAVEVCGARFDDKLVEFRHALRLFAVRRFEKPERNAQLHVRHAPRELFFADHTAVRQHPVRAHRAILNEHIVFDQHTFAFAHFDFIDGFHGLFHAHEDLALFHAQRYLVADLVHFAFRAAALAERAAHGKPKSL